MIHVHHALLFFKAESITEWTQLVDKSAFLRESRGKETISDIMFNGNIRIEQVGAPDTDLEEKKWVCAFILLLSSMPLYLNLDLSLFARVQSLRVHDLLTPWNRL